jgi:hypothetical protein
VELPGNAKDGDDPIEQKKAKKKEAVARNELQRLRILSTTMMKSKSKTRINLEPTDRPTAEQLNRSVYIVRSQCYSFESTLIFHSFSFAFRHTLLLLQWANSSQT